LSSDKGKGNFDPHTLTKLPLYFSLGAARPSG